VRERLEQLGTKEIELKVGRSGQFDITVDGALRYTRGKTGRFPTDDEVDRLVG
jgi:predicted Rdx family selenoprotein